MKQKLYFIIGLILDYGLIASALYFKDNEQFINIACVLLCIQLIYMTIILMIIFGETVMIKKAMIVEKDFTKEYNHLRMRYGKTMRTINNIGTYITFLFMVIFSAYYGLWFLTCITAISLFVSIFIHGLIKAHGQTVDRYKELQEDNRIGG